MFFKNAQMNLQGSGHWPMTDMEETMYDAQLELGESASGKTSCTTWPSNPNIPEHMPPFTEK